MHTTGTGGVFHFGYMIAIWLCSVARYCGALYTKQLTFFSRLWYNCAANAMLSKDENMVAYPLTNNEW